MVDHYRAGACNIGPVEITARRRFGHAATTVTLLLWASLLFLDAPVAVRLVLIVPATAAAAGYLQAAMHFCADYGWRGLVNLGATLRKAERVEGAAARRADRRKALQIVALSVAIGITTAAVAVAL